MWQWRGRQLREKAWPKAHHRQNQGSREDDFYSATSGLTYRLSDTADARLTYRHTARKSDAPNSDIIEDFVSLSLIKSF